MLPSTPRLGQLLLRHRLLAGGQVLECLELQSRHDGPGDRGAPLGRIALERGYLSADKLDELLREQARLSRRLELPGATGRPRARVREEFQILRPLGHDGHFGTFQALHTDTGAVVALRLLESPADAPRLDELARGVEALQRLRHPGLQPLISGGWMGSDLYFASEFLEAASLRRLLAGNTALDWRCVWDLAVQAAAALEAAHRHGLLHRRIRPSNILIGRGGRASLAQLGIGLGPRESALRSGPELLYLPPETEDSQRQPDARADLYSLGASLYHAATGRAPRTVSAPGALGALRPAAPDPAELNPDVPPPLARSILRLLSPDPDGRYASAAELLADLEELRPEAEWSPDRLDLRRRWNARIEALLEEEAPGLPVPPDAPAAPEARPSALPGRIAGALAVPLLAVLLLAPALTFFYRHAHAHRVFLQRGEHFYARRRPLEAMADFRKAQALRPDLPSIQERILSLALETKDYALAAGQIDVLRRMEPDDERRLRLLKVDLLLWGGDPSAALEGYRDFARTYGEDVEILLRIAQARAASQDLQGALEVYAAVHARHPDEPRGLLEMARLSSAIGAHDEARRLYARYLDRFPESALVLGEYGGALEACRKFGEAAKIFERLAAIAPDDGDPRFRRARALLWHGDAATARSVLLESGGGAAVSAERGEVLARAHEALRDFASAEAVWKELGALHPSRPDFALELGRLYERTGRFDAALLQIRGAQEKFGATAELIASLGRVHAARREPEQALSCFLRATRMDPADPSHPLAVARTLIWLQRPKEALDVLGGLGAKGDMEADVEVERARAFSRLGLREEGGAILRKLAAGVKEDSPFLRTLGELELESAPQPGQARLYESYLRNHPDDLDALRRFARLLRAAGDHARAWPLYRRRLETEPAGVELLLEASEEAAWAGDPESAVRLLERIRRSSSVSK